MLHSVIMQILLSEMRDIIESIDMRFLYLVHWLNVVHVLYCIIWNKFHFSEQRYIVFLILMPLFE